MPSPAIKICGVNTPEALDASIAARADYVGFNFYPPSPRYLAPRDAAELGARAANRIAKVGVFVDPDDSMLAEAIAAARLDALQLHRVTAARRAEVRQRFGLPVWAVIEVSQRADLAASGHLDAFDRVIFDAKTPRGTLPGGMGLSFDWSWLSGMAMPGPWGLAGGLTPDNIAEAVRITRAPLVDACSGIESAPGVKAVDRIAAFCEAARQ